MLVGCHLVQDRRGLDGALRTAKLGGRELQILEHRQVGRQRRVLVRHGNAHLTQGAGMRHSDFLPLKKEGPGIGRDHSGGDADQRRFARAVLADDGMDLAGHDGQIDAFQGADGSVGLPHAAQLHDRLGAGCTILAGRPCLSDRAIHGAFAGCG